MIEIIKIPLNSITKCYEWGMFACLCRCPIVLLIRSSYRSKSCPSRLGYSVQFVTSRSGRLNRPVKFSITHDNSFCDMFMRKNLSKLLISCIGSDFRSSYLTICKSPGKSSQDLFSSNQLFALIVTKLFHSEKRYLQRN